MHTQYSEVYFTFVYHIISKLFILYYISCYWETYSEMRMSEVEEEDEAEEDPRYDYFATDKI